MRIRIQAILAAMRMVPLLRSIATEIKERTRALAELEARHKALARERRAHSVEVWEIEARLIDERRELRRVEKELARLGWYVDECYPQPVLLRCKASAPGLTWRLDDASPRRAPSS